MEKRIVTYEEYGRLMNKMVEKLHEQNKRFDGIYGDPRGAWPIMVHVLHHLKVPCLTTEEFVTSNKMRFLVIDDICDMGRTFSNIYGHMLQGKKSATAFFSVLFYKPRSKFKPDLYIEEVTEWIVFPWERLDEIPNR